MVLPFVSSFRNVRWLRIPLHRHGPPGASFGSRTPSIFGCQIRNLSTTNQQWSLWLYTKHLMDMLSSFWITWFSTLESAQFFTPDRGFLLITLLLGMLYYLFFQVLIDHRFHDVWAKFLVSGVYLNLIFSFKVGPSLDLSCLMSSMFIIAH